MSTLPAQPDTVYRSSPHGSVWGRRLRGLSCGLLGLLALGCDSASQPAHSLEVAARSSQSAALARDGSWALIGSGYHGGSLWQVRDGERLFDWNHRAGEHTLITAVAFSPEGNWAATSDGQTLVLWNRVTGAAGQFWSLPANILSIALGPNGDVALLGLADNRAALYDIKRGGIVRNFPHAERVSSVALSANGRRALSGSDDGSAVLWDTENGEVLQRRQHPVEVQLVALSEDGEHILSAAKYDEVAVWNSAGQHLWQLPFATEHLRRGLQLTAARFSDDGDYLLTGRPDGLVQLWDISQQQLMYEWRLPKRKAWQPMVAAVMDVSFSPDSNRYYAASSDGFIHELNY